MTAARFEWKIDDHLEVLLDAGNRAWDEAWKICMPEMIQIAKLAIFKTRIALEDEHVNRLAVEAVSAIWDKIANQKKTFSAGLDFRAYLVGIAKNLAYKANQPARKSEVSLQALPEAEFEKSKSPLWDVTDPSEEIQRRESDAENVEISAILNTAFSLLGSPCKELITKGYIDRVKPKEIAQESGVTHKSISSRLRACKQKLEQIYYELGGRNPKRG